MRSTYNPMAAGLLFLHHQLASAQKIPVSSNNTSVTTQDNNHTYVVMASFFAVSFILSCVYFLVMSNACCKTKYRNSVDRENSERGAPNVRARIDEVLENPPVIPGASGEPQAIFSSNPLRP